MTKMVGNVRRGYHFWRLSSLFIAPRFETRYFKKKIGELYTKFWWGDLRERDHLEDLGAEGMIILKRVSKEWKGEHGLN